MSLQYTQVVDLYMLKYNILNNFYLSNYHKIINIPSALENMLDKYFHKLF